MIATLARTDQMVIKIAKVHSIRKTDWITICNLILQAKKIH